MSKINFYCTVSNRLESGAHYAADAVPYSIGLEKEVQSEL